MTERLPRRGTRRKAPRRALTIAPESLEERSLMAYTGLGFSLPDLKIVDAYSGPVGALGGPLAVTIDVQNLGTSTIPEPLNQFPGSTSSADAPASQVAVYLATQPHAPFGQRYYVGTVDVPAIPQNRLARVTSTLTLPDTLPAGFPTTGQTAYLTFQVDPSSSVRDYSRTNNVTRPATSFQLVPQLPDLQATAFGVPPGLKAGDTFVPQVKLANLGAAFTAPQGPVTVEVVASLDPYFGPGDQTLATFTVGDLAPLSTAPTQNFVLGDNSSIYDPVNVTTLTADSPVTLPASPAVYYVGVVVDPQNQIAEIGDLGGAPSALLEQVHLVSPSGDLLPPAGVLGAPMTPTPVFPNPPFTTPTGGPVMNPITSTTPDVVLAGGLAARRAAFQSRSAPQSSPIAAAMQARRAMIRFQSTVDRPRLGWRHG